MNGLLKVIIGAILCALFLCVLLFAVGCEKRADKPNTPAFTAEAQAAEIPRPLPPDIPRNVLKYRNPLIREIRYHWSLEQPPAIFFGQIHQESGWRADVSSAYATGLTQFTPDTAKWIQELYPADLGEFCASASGCPLDPRWAIRAMLIYDKRLYAYFTRSVGDDRYAFMLASYNGGLGWAQREQDAARDRGLIQTRWFKHVETVCLRAKWACEENRAYPQRILYRWRPVYADWLGF